MNKTENHEKFIKDFMVIYKKAKMTSLLLRILSKHRYFQKYSHILGPKRSQSETQTTSVSTGSDESALTDGEKLVTILWELTRERSSCDALVQVFKDAGQEELANMLKEYNTSKGDWPLSPKIELNVTPKTAPNNDSNCYNDLTRNPRGKCVIINNVEDQQCPDYFDDSGQSIVKLKGLRNETLRFQNIFRQLFFDVIILTEGTNGLTAQEIKRKLTDISKDPTLINDKAFVLIIISHGQNECVYGSKACEWIKKTKFNKELEKDPEVQNAIEEDCVKIDDLIDIFSVGKCPQLKDRPKLHFFICCREESQTIGLNPSPKNDENNFVNQTSMNREQNLDTFVSYACAKGYQSFFNFDWGMSYFGQAFTHAIAQYACDSSLSGIMTRTIARLNKIYEDRLHLENWPQGSFNIEIRQLAMKKELQFNPGYADEH